ncbi:MAG: hypothetical protein ACREJU_13960 [Nitrospiraceae bacterium]
MNRLAIARTDIQPGSLILVGRQGPIYTGHLRSYISSPELLLGDSFSEYAAVIGRYQGDRALSAEVAVSFIQGLFQFSPTAKFAVSGTVRIDMVESHAQRMEVDQIKKFIGRQEAQPFVQTVLEALANGEHAYLAYEVHRAKRLKISSASGRDLAPSIEVGAIGNIPIKGEGKLSYKKLSEREMLLEGEQEYAFAVRTGELLRGEAANSIKFKVTNFLKPGYVKSAGTDDQYSSPVLEGFAPLTLASKTGP